MASPQKNWLGGLAQLWKSMPMGRRIALGTLVLFGAFAVAYLVNLAGADEFVTAFAGMKHEDAARITEKLDAEKISYELDAGGTMIRVPVEQQHKVRLMAASEGLTNGGVGFEIFDEPRFGMTSFEKNMNYRRALQGELRRTITSLQEVDDTRIHIVLPRKATFREDDQEASASVVLTLRSNLSKDRVRGVVNLVASSVEGLMPERVTIVDQKGKVLSAPVDPQMAGTMPALEYRQSVEQDMEKRILMLLAPVLGSQNVQVHVTAAVDFRRIEKMEETFDKEQAVVRKEHSMQRMQPNADGAAQGVAGVQANLPGAGGGEEGAKRNVAHSEKTVSYEVPVKRLTIAEPVGKVEKLHVAVLVNGAYEGEGEAKAYVARSSEEIAKLESIVKAAAGFDAARGDMVVVRDMPFQEELMLDEPAQSFSVPPEAWRLGRYALIFILALMLLFFVVRPLVKAVSASADAVVVEAERVEAEAVAESAAPQDKNEPADLFMDDPNRPNTRLLALDFAEREPRKTAQILRAWLLEDGASEAMPGGSGQSFAPTDERQRAPAPRA